MNLLEQLAFFSDSDTSEILIPEDVISPLESNKRVKSKEFRGLQIRWSSYVRAIQEAQG